MHIKHLDIKNFRGISKISAQNLAGTVIIASQNGSGKSCIFDAIRLLKSAYCGYQRNEWQSFFSEFQIQFASGDESVNKLFNRKNKTSP